MKINTKKLWIPILICLILLFGAILIHGCIENPSEDCLPDGGYWLEGEEDPVEAKEELINKIAWSKEMCSDEVRERFDELFPDVDLQNMTFIEYVEFIKNLPVPPIRPVCLEEVRQSPYTIAVFGEMPSIHTEAELRKFSEKLEVIVNEVIEPIPSPVRDLVECQILITSTHEGAIRIGIYGDYIAEADRIYEIISESAERLFGIENVPVIITGGVRIMLLCTEL